MAARWRNSLSSALTRPLLLFLGVTLALWVFGGGIPYGYDGIEVYFTYLIGYNAATFSQVNPLMADIVASPNPEAHPYYYTHHPNLAAHLLSQGLVRLGIADLRLHGLVAILISAAGVLIGARTLCAMLGESVAVAYVLVSSVHYVGVLSWAPVLLRSLHFLFFWTAIALARRYAVAPGATSLLAVCLWTYLLFLNDYTLAAFAFLVQLALVVLEAGPARALRFGAATGFAASISIVTWLGVLIGQLGRDVVIEDIGRTFIARNAGRLVEDQQAIVDFYRQHRIVFWNVVSRHSPIELLRVAWLNAFKLGHGLLTLPIYGVSIWILGSVAAHPFARANWRDGWKRLSPAASAVPQVEKALRAGALFGPIGVTAGALILAVPWPGHSGGLQNKLLHWLPLPGSALILAGVVMALMFVMQRATARMRVQPTGETSARDRAVWIGAAAVILALFVAFDALAAAQAASMVVLPGLIGPRLVAWIGGAFLATLSLIAGLAVGAVLASRHLGPSRASRFIASIWPLWLLLVGPLAASAVATGVTRDLSTLYANHPGATQALVRQLPVVALGVSLLAIIVSAGIALCRRSGAHCLEALTLPAPPSASRAFVRYVVAMAIAIVTMTAFAPGAFTANFVYTYKPALVFLEDVVLAALLVTALRSLRALPASTWRRPTFSFLLAASAFYWLSYQAALAYRYAPTELGIATALRQEAFRGASFVEPAMYAAIWYYTRGVAYSVPRELTSQGGLDFETLMFFHDRDAKAATYRHPQYLACVRQHTLEKFFCERWISQLKALGYGLRRGENFLFDEDYLIFRFPNAGAEAR
jgi:hypothetical protein